MELKEVHCVDGEGPSPLVAEIGEAGENCNVGLLDIFVALPVVETHGADEENIRRERVDEGLNYKELVDETFVGFEVEILDDPEEQKLVQNLQEEAETEGKPLPPGPAELCCPERHDELDGHCEKGDGGQNLSLEPLAEENRD